MTIEIDSATATVTLDLQGLYTAEQLLDLIKQLSAARARIARDPSKPGEMWLAPKAACHTQLLGQAGPDSLLAMKFPGLGWTGFTLSPEVRAKLIVLLATQQSLAMTSVAAPAAVEVVANPEPGPSGPTLH